MYPFNRLTRNYIPCLGQTRTKLHTLFRTEKSKTIPCPAAHPRIGNLRREYPPPSQIQSKTMNYVNCVSCDSVFAVIFCLKMYNETTVSTFAISERSCLVLSAEVNHDYFGHYKILIFYNLS